VVLIAGMQTPAAAQAPLSASINASPGADTVTISRHIYGHFAEHLGRDIYDGFWYRPSETAPWQYRDDIIEALKKIRIPNLRWPGGCFADYYHWKDGIGPQAQRAPIVNSSWGGVIEDNSFGTHEYFELVRRLGTEPFVVGNVGSGTVQEMVDWWDYINHPGGSPMANLRKANGRAEPWQVRFWGIGNESWGCGGNFTPEAYATEYRRFATYIRAVGDVRPFRIATGPNSADTAWMVGLMANAARQIDGIDLHYYTRTRGSVVPQLAAAGGGQGAQGQGPPAQQGPELNRSATGFTESEWFVMLRNALRTDELVQQHSAIMDRYDPQKRIWLIVGEWGTWHSTEPGTNPRFLYQQNALRDALVASVSLDVFNRHADRVKMANIAQTINVLQAMILTQGPQMILTPTYHVFEMYTVHHDATRLPLTYEAGSYEFENRSIPAITASASRDRAGKVHITMSNLDPNQPRTVRTTLDGARLSRVAGRILTADKMDAHNTFEQPTALQPVVFNGARLSGNTLNIDLPAKSIVVLELQ